MFIVKRSEVIELLGFTSDTPFQFYRIPQQEFITEHSFSVTKQSKTIWNVPKLLTNRLNPEL